VLVRRLLAVAAEKTGQRLQSESARGRKRLLALGDGAAEFCFGARGAERGAAEGMGMELSVAPPWELGSGNGCPPCRGFYGFPDTSPMVYRGFSDSEELQLCFCSSVRVLGFYCRTDRQTNSRRRLLLISIIFLLEKVSHHLPSEKKGLHHHLAKEILLVLAMQGLSRYDTRTKGRRY